jgi:hypothetical protein
MKLARGMWRSLALTACLLGCGEGASEPRWRQVPALEQHGWLVSTTASPDGKRWLAFGGAPDRGVIIRSDDLSAWTVEQTPEVPLLNWGQLFADGTAIVVGNAGTALRFDGSHWSRQELPTREDLWGVWGTQPNDVWAVGGAGQREGQATLLHYDGRSWSTVAIPQLERPNVWALYKVWGSAGDDVYAVGQRGAVLHYDGSSWREQGVGIGEDLIAVYGTARDRIAIVGGRSSGVIAAFDGIAWRTRQLAPMAGLNGVWMGDPDTIHVAGAEGTLAQLDFATLTAEPEYQPTRLTFHALHGAGQRVLAVGGNLGASQPPYQGLARVRSREANE